MSAPPFPPSRPLHHRPSHSPHTLLSEMEIIIQPLPRQHLLNLQPRFPIRQRTKKPKTPHKSRNNNPTSRPRRQKTLSHNPFPYRLTSSLNRLTSTILLPVDDRVCPTNVCDFLGFDIEDEFYDRARDEAGGQVRGEVVVQEELTAHDEEGEIVRSPDEEEETGAVVEAAAGAYKWSSC